MPELASAPPWPRPSPPPRYPSAAWHTPGISQVGSIVCSTASRKPMPLQISPTGQAAQAW
eukprot:CAMPEP_0204283926 /NCGR_PEP_ID=MMETSP0468-20130131/47314_1 /ASSEMBLY_ACC=CAM_ASM_000383 /TAXON_ID=2969 /ORGANISM="Oxyrrhis marina" /LENGTH=59 /DNA_ID=CAMNT_0051261603 /DNA_START=44 /DNA_END=220 /DNA_ORIENTATION=+